jgi:CheY-like chemotaxis protein/HPt (histidine-containing phosphotransfer) domain-containing protein
VGDAGRLRQVLVNLVGNAIKFTERGEVVVEVQRATTAEADKELGTSPGATSEVELLFSVRDTGIGVPGGKLASIFGPFTQVDSSTTRTYGGTGLGLTISARIVALMGGRVWVESELGKASRFSFTARFRRSPNQRGPRRPRELFTLKAVPVLVVDDNATNRRILEKLLGAWGLAPTSASSGAEALGLLTRACAAGEPFRLVLLDAMMPEMDGFALAEEINRHPDLAVPVLMMLSSSDRPGDPQRCRQLGLARYLTKPVNQSDLLEAILEALGDRDENRTDGRTATGGAPAAGEPPGPRPRWRVLLAEDNVVNQKLAVHLLEKQGHEVVVANDGKEALAQLERQSFDLVLMDVQMPEMDGLEAAAQIRASENGTGRHVPIVAMTAHAMKGDRERCLEAGMDDYVSKPIQARELLNVMARVAPPSAGAATVVDADAALQTLGGDPGLLHQLAHAFLDDYPRSLARVRAAVTAGEATAVERAAHSLKGAVGVFGAPRAMAAAQRLETLGRLGALEEATGAFAALETELLQVRRALSELLARETRRPPS